jgi:hypothetical protein
MAQLLRCEPRPAPPVYVQADPTAESGKARFATVSFVDHVQSPIALVRPRLSWIVKKLLIRAIQPAGRAELNIGKNRRSVSGAIPILLSGLVTAVGALP